MPKSRALAVRLPIETWDHLSEEARSKGLTLSGLARTRLMLTSEFEGPIQACIDDFSKRLGISRHEFIEAVLIDFMARISADQSGGNGRYRFLPQFVYTDHGLLRGSPLFEYMRSYYARRDGETKPVDGVAPIGVGGGSGVTARIDSDRSAMVRGEQKDTRPAGEGRAHVHGDEAPAMPNFERARIEQAMFDRIMQHYGEKISAEESTDEESES